MVQGRLAPCTEIFLRDTTSSTDMNDYAPKRLTRRQITSKQMGVFDIKGLVIPLTARCKPALRDVFKETPTWDLAVSDGQGARWAQRYEIPQRWDAY